MNLKFLIDECLSPKLVDVAIKHGFMGSSCVIHRGWSGLKDWELMNKVYENDFILVTNNAIDFRGRGKTNPGGLFAKSELHNGLVCLTASGQMNLQKQIDAFEEAIQNIKRLGDLLNSAIEVHVAPDGSLSAVHYAIP